MIKISEKSTEYTIEWYRRYVLKYGGDKVYLSQDQNGINYIVVEGDDENRSYDVSSQLTSTQSLSPSELESIPF